MKMRRPNTGSAFVIQCWATFNQPHSLLSHTFTRAETQSTCPRSIQLKIRTKQTKLEMCFHVCLQLKIAPASMSENAVTQQGITPCWSCENYTLRCLLYLQLQPKLECIFASKRSFGAVHTHRGVFFNSFMSEGCSELHQALCVLRRMIKKKKCYKTNTSVRELSIKAWAACSVTRQHMRKRWERHSTGMNK